MKAELFWCDLFPKVMVGLHILTICTHWMMSFMPTYKKKPLVPYCYLKPNNKCPTN